MKPLITLAALAALAAGAHAAGTVQVQFVQPDKYVDVYDADFKRDRNLEVLKEHLERAGARVLTDGQVLKIDVLDVDLAGRTRRDARLHDVRVLDGKADWPRIELRYTLETPGQPARTGQASITDMNYLERLAISPPAQEPLRYERRMLDDWFKAEFSR
jgi:hypothetical protein